MKKEYRKRTKRSDGQEVPQPILSKHICHDLDLRILKVKVQTL